MQSHTHLASYEFLSVLLCRFSKILVVPSCVLLEGRSVQACVFVKKSGLPDGYQHQDELETDSN